MTTRRRGNLAGFNVNQGNTKVERKKQKQKQKQTQVLLVPCGNLRINLQWSTILAVRPNPLFAYNIIIIIISDLTITEPIRILKEKKNANHALLNRGLEIGQNPNFFFEVFIEIWASIITCYYYLYTYTLGFNNNNQEDKKEWKFEKKKRKKSYQWRKRIEWWKQQERKTQQRKPIAVSMLSCSSEFSFYFLWLKNSRVLKILTVFRSTENSERKRIHSQAPVSFSHQTMSFHFERTYSWMYVYWIFLECNSLVPQV